MRADRTVYLNGDFRPAEDAKVSIFDRGLLFADAVYEVAGVIDGKLLDFDSHMSRLERSLQEMRIDPPMSPDEILVVMREMVSRNAVEEGLVYLQITRGSEGDREFVPTRKTTPTVFMFTQHKSAGETAEAETGIVLHSAPDIRWARRDIKTVGLMGSVFAKWAAKEAGAGEVLMHQDGYVTECGATSFYIVKNETVITRPLSNAILPGCTRKALLTLMQEKKADLEERLFTLEEVYAADEAFISGASTYICPVTRVDGREIGNGKRGKVTKALQETYLTFARKTAK